MLRCVASAIVSVVLTTPANAAVETSDAGTFGDADLVDVRALVPDIALEIRYAGTRNFVGTRIDGYEAEKCFLKSQAAQALQRVEASLRSQGLRLKIFDCYRPVRAVQHFVRCAEDIEDQRTKRAYYPKLDKSQLLGEYIAPVSGHGRGATVDLTLMKCDANGCAELDMGTPFDFFDERAHTDHAAITREQRDNRQALRKAMEREGFENYSAEWWHYTFKPEPTPNLQYDLVVR
jgi:D-alanyl-D-alanine dipeptidase